MKMQRFLRKSPSVRQGLMPHPKVQDIPIVYLTIQKVSFKFNNNNALITADTK